MRKLFELQKLYLNASANIDIELEVFYSDLYRMLSLENFDANFIRQVKTIRKSISGMDFQFETLRNHSKNVQSKLKDLRELQEISDEIFLSTPSKLALPNLELKYQHLSLLVAEIHKNIKNVQGKNFENDSHVKEALKVFLVLDARNDGFLNFEKMRSCLETLGFVTPAAPNSSPSKSSQEQFNQILEEIKSDDGQQRVYLDKFLQYVLDKRSKHFRSNSDIVDSFSSMASNADYITEKELIDVIFFQLGLNSKYCSNFI